MHEQLFVEIFIELTAQKNRQSNDHFQVQVGPHHPASGPPHCSGLSMQPNFFLIIEIQNCRIRVLMIVEQLCCQPVIHVICGARCKSSNTRLINVTINCQWQCSTDIQ